VAKSRVARLSTNNLVGAHSRKKWRRGRPDAGGVPDLLNRNFFAAAPNQRWVVDIPEFPTGDGKLYLAGIRDLHHRGIVGWDTSGRQDAALVVSALTMALGAHRSPRRRRAPCRQGIAIIHLAGLRVRCRQRRHDPVVRFHRRAFDNATMETFWARLKVEIAWIRGSIWFPTRAEAHGYLFEFIEVFYNRQRHQGGLGHLTPSEYADKWRHDHGQPNLP